MLNYIGTQCFATLQVSFLALSLCFVCEFDISVMCMFTAWHCVHAHYFQRMHSAHIMHFNFDYYYLFFHALNILCRFVDIFVGELGVNVVHCWVV